MKSVINTIISKLFTKNKRPTTEQCAPGSAYYTAPTEIIDMGNKTFHKDYEAAIADGLELLKSSPNDPMIHINLMDAYQKNGEADKATEHAKLAMLCGHHTGFAEQRLAINLEKKKYYHQSIQLYNLILDTPGFHFSKCGIGNTIDFSTRREKAAAKLPKAADKETDKLFSDDEIFQIIGGIKRADIYEARAEKAFRERMKKMRDEILKMED